MPKRLCARVRRSTPQFYGHGVVGAMSSVHVKRTPAVQLVGGNALLNMYLPFRVHHAPLEHVHSAALLRQIGG